MSTPVDQALAARYQAVAATFSGRWREGTLDWLRRNAVGNVVVMTMAEDQLNAAWVRARQGQSVTAEFEAALERWRQAQTAAIAEFESKNVGAI